MSLDEAGLQLPEADAVLLFHSVRELLFNVLKHGQTDRAAVSMTYTQNVLSLTVSDKGCGFDLEKLRDDRSDRFGLLSIRERMMDLGGRFDLQSEPGRERLRRSICPARRRAGLEVPATERSSRSPRKRGIPADLRPWFVLNIYPAGKYDCGSDIDCRRSRDG